MSGTREDWATLLPLVQAFVEGKPVQRLGYDGRWTPANALHNLLYSVGKYRLAPDSWEMGTWQVEFTEGPDTHASGPIARGVVEWKGASTDAPPWPKGGRRVYNMESETFFPDGQEEPEVMKGQDVSDDYGDDDEEDNDENF